MRSIGIPALGPKPRTTNPAPGHKIFPYLPHGLAIERPNQVADISYIPIGRGFLYLVAIMDWASRRCWRGGCRTPRTPRSAATRLRRRSSLRTPETFNTDKGSQFTTGMLAAAG